MENIFLYVVKMSLTAGCVVPVVLLIRLLLKKAPKKYSYLLWSVVGFRLLCPFSFPSRISLFNIGIFDFFRADRSSTGKGVQDLTAVGAVQGNFADAVVDVGMGTPVEVAENIVSRGDLTENMVQPITDSVAAGSTHSINTLLGILAVIWLAGATVMIVYGVVSYLTLAWKLRKAVRVSGKENVYRSERIGTPFVMGIIKPVIYIPDYLEGDDAEYVLLHEECHIKRHDYTVKPAAFILLCIHWFNPLIWVAFYAMNKDMEMSCDEKVIAQNSAGFDDDSSRICKEYSYALLKCASTGHFPLLGIQAFGRTSVKERIVNVLDYKKPKRIVTLSAMVLCAVVLAACSANPKETDKTVQIGQTQSQNDNANKADGSQQTGSGQNTDNTQNTDSEQKADNTQQTESEQSTENTQNTYSSQNPDNSQKSDNSGNTDNNGTQLETPENTITTEEETTTVLQAEADIEVKEEEVKVAEPTEPMDQTETSEALIVVDNTPVQTASNMVDITKYYESEYYEYVQPDLSNKPEYPMPVENAEITADFGYRFVMDKTQFHSGVDFSAEAGSEVHAGADGTVVACGWGDSHGLVVIIYHENGYATHYYNLSGIIVKEGEKVKEGDIIGYSGASGNATAPMLHFGVSYYDTSSGINYIEPVFSSNK